MRVILVVLGVLSSVIAMLLGAVYVLPMSVTYGFMREVETMDQFVYVVLGLAVILYFFPTIIAIDRKHPSMGGVIVVNIFLGWTFLGWVVALAWSLSSTGAKGRHV